MALYKCIIIIIIIGWNDAFSAVFGLDQTCHMLAFVGL